MWQDDMVYTLDEIARATGYCVKTVRRRMKEGYFTRVTRERQKVLILGSEIKKWLKIT